MTAEDVAAVAAGWTGIPVTTLTQEESRRLLSLEEELHRRVVARPTRCAPWPGRGAGAGWG